METQQLYTGRVQIYMSCVYMTLFTLMLAYTTGVIVAIFGSVTIPVALSPAITVVVFALLIDVVTKHPMYVQTRLVESNIMMSLLGVMSGPLVRIAINIDPHIVVTAAAITLITFLSLTALVLYFPQREYLLLASFLSPILTSFVFFGLMNLFLKSPLLFRADVYGGIVLFSGFIMADTYMLWEKAHTNHNNPHPDYILDALGIALDIVNLFIRILIALIESNKKKK